MQPTSTQTPNYLQKPRPFRPLTSPLPPLTLSYLPNNKIPDVKHEHIHYHIQADGGEQYQQQQATSEPSLGSYLANVAQSAGGQDPGYSYSDRPSALTGSVPGQPGYYGQFRSEDEPYFPDGADDETEQGDLPKEQQSSYKFVITNTFPFFEKVSVANELDSKPSSFRRIEYSDSEADIESITVTDDLQDVKVEVTNSTTPTPEDIIANTYTTQIDSKQDDTT